MQRLERVLSAIIGLVIIASGSTRLNHIEPFWFIVIGGISLILFSGVIHLSNLVSVLEDINKKLPTPE